MFVIVLKFSGRRDRAADLVEGHNAWIRRGFDDGIFLLVGSLHPGQGGAILAHNVSRAELEGWVRDDPFVAEEVVSADILEIAPSRTDRRLQFLMD